MQPMKCKHDMSRFGTIKVCAVCGEDEVDILEEEVAALKEENKALWNMLSTYASKLEILLAAHTGEES